MNRRSTQIQAELSLYPLRTVKIGGIIRAFIREMEHSGLHIEAGAMSTIISGDVDAVFSTVKEAFRAATEKEQVTLLMKVSNACPSIDAENDE